jgi:hypothetical protein
MWLKKLVKQYGGMGQVSLPKNLIGTEVLIITEDEERDLKELIEVTLIHRKAFKLEQNELIQKVNELETELKSRLTRLEKVVFQ